MSKASSVFAQKQSRAGDGPRSEPRPFRPGPLEADPFGASERSASRIRPDGVSLGASRRAFWILALAAAMLLASDLASAKSLSDIHISIDHHRSQTLSAWRGILLLCAFGSWMRAAKLFRKAGDFPWLGRQPFSVEPAAEVRSLGVEHGPTPAPSAGQLPFRLDLRRQRLAASACWLACALALAVIPSLF